jgi:hypothetical protein
MVFCAPIIITSALFFLTPRNNRSKVQPRFDVMMYSAVQAQEVRVTTISARDGEHALDTAQALFGPLAYISRAV